MSLRVDHERVAIHAFLQKRQGQYASFNELLRYCAKNCDSTRGSVDAVRRLRQALLDLLAAKIIRQNNLDEYAVAQAGVSVVDGKRFRKKRKTVEEEEEEEEEGEDYD